MGPQSLAHAHITRLFIVLGSEGVLRLLALLPGVLCAQMLSTFLRTEHLQGVKPDTGKG